MTASTEPNWHVVLDDGWEGDIYAPDLVTWVRFDAGGRALVRATELGPPTDVPTKPTLTIKWEPIAMLGGKQDIAGSLCDGDRVLWSHVSSSRGWLENDLLGGSGGVRADHLAERYPHGYEVVWEQMGLPDLSSPTLRTFDGLPSSIPLTGVVRLTDSTGRILGETTMIDGKFAEPIHVDRIEGDVFISGAIGGKLDMP